MKQTLTRILNDVTRFSQASSRITLRQYQRAVAQAVCQSVTRGQGLSFVVMFPRQSGKNELQAQIEAYLLTLLSDHDAEIVKVSPTWKPQSLNAMRRLQRVLERCQVTHILTNGSDGGWVKESGYIYRVGRARIFFLSGGPEANIVGATASTLLEVDEAQDVQIAKFDRDIAPMAASTNATRVFWGTAWSSESLLARELRAAREAETRDGIRRAFVLTAEEVAGEVPAYGRFVAEQVARLGRDHPMVRTQYFSEEIGAEGGMFPPQRQALMRGSHEHRSHPPADSPRQIAFLLDVAGEETGAGMQAIAGQTAANPRRDATVLTIVEIDPAGLEDEGLRAPIYRVLDRQQWVGLPQTALYARVMALAESWQPRKIVVDATGIGAGLSSFLEKALPGRVLPFVFSLASKSRLGWDFLAMCDTGRFKDWQDGQRDALQELFWRQLSACQYSLQSGPGQLMRWSVPDGTRDALDGTPLHDDLVMSAALCAVLDGENWSGGAAGMMVERGDVLEEMDREGF